jgi:intracellular multiplication protein IcmJ
MAVFKPTLNLAMSVKTKNWRMDDNNSESADAEFQQVRIKILQRDNYICAGCGFRSTRYQEVHHRDDDHANNDPKNLITACSFCHMCQHIGLAGYNKEAVVIWLPEISQADLHHIVRNALVARRSFEAIKKDMMAQTGKVKAARFLDEAASSLMHSLMDRMEEAENRLSSDPSVIADALMMLDDLIYDKRADFLSGLRLLPLGVRKNGAQNEMDKIVDGWLETGGPYNGIQPTSWKTIRDGVLS